MSFRRYWRGGGIYCDGGTISNNFISNNFAQATGGGIAAYGSSTVLNNVISNNNVYSGNGGGGIYVTGYPVISGNLITNNYGGYVGGGIYSTGSNFKILSNFIANNSATYGGGIGSTSTSTNSRINNNLISNNSATAGGGIATFPYFDGTFTNNTITNNSATYGGALYCVSNTNPIFRNSILWGNTASSSGSQVYLNTDDCDPDFYYCNIQGNSSAFDLNGWSYSGTYKNNLDSNPQFVAPSDSSGTSYNGAVANWALQFVSPCINKGDSIGTYSAIDIIGNKRITSCFIDIGAYEYQYKDSLNDSILLKSCGDSALLDAGSGFKSYNWNTGEMTQKIYAKNRGWYKVTVGLNSGCSYSDSVFVEGSGIDIVDTSCNSYSFNGNTITKSGVYLDTLTNIGGCDSIVTLILTIKNSLTKTLIQTACNSIIYKGNVYASSGFYYDTLKNTMGCDSIITLNLTIKNSTYHTINKTSCDKYTFNGNKLTTSGVYYDTLTNAVGCDSIITLNLTINSSSGIVIYDTACGSYSFKGSTIAASGTYYDTLANAVGCDSIVTLHLIIQNTNFSLSFTQNTQVFTTPPFDVLFLNTTPNKNNYTFTWLYGDGTYYNGTNPPKHTYQANGTYDVTLIAQNNATGCTDTLYKQGWILCSGGCTHTAQIIQSNIAKKCVGDSIYLSCVSASTYSYQWYFNANKIVGATDSFIYLKTAGQYSVTVTDNNCSLTSPPVTVSFYPSATKPIIAHNGSLVFCTGGSVELYVNNIYNTYNWNTGSQTYHTYVSNSGTYVVNVSDSNGCQVWSDTFSLNASFISPPPICLVGVDSTTNKNIIIWEKTNAGSIDSFVILKETSQANQYNMIGKLPYSAFSTFIDTASNPNVQANRYKLQAIDTCGIKTLPSDYHKTIHLTINKGQGTNWNLIWSHYEGIQFSSYNIYRGSSSTNMSLLTTIASNLNSYTDINPPSGNLYYQIEVVNAQGCTPSQKTDSYSSSKSNIADVGTIGIANIYNSKYNVFPNPTTSQLTIQSSQKLFNATIKLYNITGQIIIQKTNLSGDNFSFDLAEYAKGIYILEINGGEGLERVKVVKE